MLPGCLHLYSDVRLLVSSVESGLTPEMTSRSPDFICRDPISKVVTFSTKGHEGDTVQPIISKEQIFKMG